MIRLSWSNLANTCEKNSWIARNEIFKTIIAIFQHSVFFNIILMTHIYTTKSKCTNHSFFLKLRKKIILILDKIRLKLYYQTTATKLPKQQALFVSNPFVWVNLLWLTSRKHLNFRTCHSKLSCTCLILMRTSFPTPNTQPST